jgi:hypothetical protein
MLQDPITAYYRTLRQLSTLEERRSPSSANIIEATPATAQRLGIVGRKGRISVRANQHTVEATTVY